MSKQHHHGSKSISFGDIITNNVSSRQLPPLSTTPTPSHSVLTNNRTPIVAQQPKRLTPLPALTSTPSLTAGSSVSHARSRSPTQSLYTAVAAKAHVVDYSFMDISQLEQLITMEPRVGVLRKDFLAQQQQQRLLAASSTAAASGAGLFPNGVPPNHSSNVAEMEAWQQHMHTSHGRTKVTVDGTVILKAKDETYAFKQMDSLIIVDKSKDARRYTTDESGNLVERNLTIDELAEDSQDTQLLCTTLQLSRNQLTVLTFGVQAFNEVMARRFYDPVAKLTHIDLSFNKLKEVPVALGQLPLHSLLMHCNSVDHIKGLVHLHTLSKTLKKFSINENPVQESMGRKLKWAVLYCFPFLECLDDVRVTPADREKLTLFGSMFGKNFQSLTSEGYAAKLAADAAAKRFEGGRRY